MKTNLFYRQVEIAKWQFGLILFSCAGLVLIVLSQFFPISDNEVVLAAMWYAGMGTVITTGAIQLTLWIGGIINAVRVNKITDSSKHLVVFSIITFWFIHLIIAIKERNKNKYAIVKDAETTINYIDR